MVTAPAVREFEVDLPIGVGPAGSRRRDASLRRMRGYEEELLGEPGMDGVRLSTELLRACTVRLGGEEAPDAGTIAALHVADRDYLLLELRRISYGDTLAAAYPCPYCGSETAVSEDLSALPVNRLDPDEALPEPVVELEDGYRDRDGSVHTSVRLRLPRGTDEAFVALALANSRAQAQDALMLRCIASFGTLSRSDLDAYGGRVLRELTVGDRARLMNRLGADAPGVRWTRDVRCGHCGRRAEHSLDVSRFFSMG